MQISTCDAWNVNGYELMISKAPFGWLKNQPEFTVHG